MKRLRMCEMLPGKAPFHEGLFSSAIENLLGQPDHKSHHAYDGVYEWFWKIDSSASKAELTLNLKTAREWMNCFDMRWPESRCDIAKWNDSPKPDTEYLRITVVDSREPRT